MNGKIAFASAICGALSFGAVALHSAPATACGGFFCNANQPVNQAAERIIFSDNPDGTVTAVVQILYEGPSESFAWVLPVPTVPDDVKVSSDAAFVAIQNATNPTYSLTTTVEGECMEDDFFASPTGDGAGLNNGGGNESDGGDVTVLAAGNVGPYDWVVIDIAEDAMDKVQIALDWLSMNGYDLTDLGPDVIAPYLEDGMFLMAFKLTKSADDGDIRPIRITYQSDTPMIPIKLTAVAANEDMGVLTWVLGEERAVPVNYKDLVLNEALINWFNPGPTYNDVVIAAANEAGGQGFVTEFAGAKDVFDQVVYPDWKEQEWSQITAEDWTGRNLELLLRVYWFAGTDDQFSFQFIPWDGMSEAIDVALPLLDPGTKQELLDFGPYNLTDADVADMDPQQFLDAVFTWVVEPMVETQDLLLTRPYVTRMYTTMSAAEMTLDPVFDFNADLDDWSNVHTGERIIECHPNITQSSAPWRAELPSGLLVRGTGGTWPIDLSADMPINQQINQAGTSGPSEVLEDNLETIKQALEGHNSSVPTGEEMGKDAAKGDVGGGGCGCASTNGSSVPLSALLFFGFVATRRRRRD